ncbi:MAG: alanine--glyoxylate aminotransferase family protein [candidate division WOR-3 bacterium]|nr:MAG: alanine--glyoxylate aminotransferase family protein [candidate division WOR-3 bacterium]
MTKPTARPKYQLFTPGPVQVPRDIRSQLAGDLVYHREAAFGKIYASVRSGLKRVMLTKGDVFLLTSSGTGAMEAAVSNLVGPGDKVLVAVSGKFGERWRELCIRFGGYVDSLTRPYGESVPPMEVERHLRATDTIKCVFTTLTETSTGALNDIRSFGEICRRLNRILVVDAVAGLGADEMRTDAWKVDVVIGGSQKALAVPPGLAFIALGPRAWDQVESAKGTCFYFDLKSYRRFAEKGQTPWTPAISLMYGLDLALRRIVKSGGVSSYWSMHRRMAQFVRSGVKRMGLELFPENPSNALTVVNMPKGVDGARVVDRCKKEGFLFANGQANLRSKIVRIGHMGPVKKSHMVKALASFRRAIKAEAGRRR